MSSMYSSVLAITSISAHGRNCASVRDSASSDTDAVPIIKAVVVTRRRLQVSPMMEAACASSPAPAIITTRSAVLISSTRSLVRPARSCSQPLIENGLSPGSWRNALAKADAVRKLAWFHEARARRSTTRSLGRSSAITLTARGFEFGSLIRKRCSSAVVTRALSLRMLSSNRGWRSAGTRRQRVFRRVLEGLIRRQHHRRRAHALMRGINAGRRDPLVQQRLDRAQQAMACHDNSIVGRDQIFLHAVHDRSHALLQRGVLHGDAFHAAIGAARLLRRPIDQIIVVLVGERAERA